MTLITDFGRDSPYVAQMKGVILGRAPETAIVDVTHSVAPQDVQEAAWILADVVDAFPRDAIHVVVVDPGVGSRRKIVCVEFSFGTCVTPDNGLVTGLVDREEPTRITHVSNHAYWRRNPSETFHGRDIMAPVAAAIAKGLDPSRLGKKLSHIELLKWPKVARGQRSIAGIVAYVDSFGNLITNISRHDLTSIGDGTTSRIHVGGLTIMGIETHYAAASDGSWIALFGSGDRLEIALVGGNAQQQTGIEAGADVQFEW